MVFIEFADVIFLILIFMYNFEAEIFCNVLPVFTQFRSVEETTQAMAFDGIMLQVLLKRLGLSYLSSKHV